MTFEQSVQIVLMHEGGFVAHPKDPGGVTKYGISKRAFPKEDIANLTLEKAKELYKKHYWDMCECDRLPGFARLMVFDCAVNQGVVRAATFLQRLGKVKVDSIIGPKTIASVAQIDPMDFIFHYQDHRFNAYTSNPNWSVFGKGWIKRLNHITYIAYVAAATTQSMH